MAQRIKGITVEIGGDTVGLQKALKDVDDKSRDIQKELRDVNRLLKFDPENVEAITQKQKLMNEQVELTSKRLKQLRDAESQVEKQFNLGEISETQFRAFRREIGFTERSLENLRKSIDDVDRADTKTARRSLRKLKDAAKDVKDELDKVKSGFAGLGAGAVAGVGGLVTGMQDYNQDLARLRTNAEIAGNDLGLVEEAFLRITEVTGESDSAVETVSNLLASGFSDVQLGQVIDEINGAAIKFSDTLKTEGIADGIQETFATGKAIGQFGELLERSGVNVDEFNERLAGAKTEGERANIILQTMQEQGLSGVFEKYKELNPEVQRSAEANASLQQSLGELAIVFAPIVASITELLTKLFEWMQANPELTITIVAIVAAIGAVIGIAMALAPVLALITGLAAALNIGMLPIIVTILAIVAVIAGLIAAGIWLYKNWDTVKAKAGELATTIATKFNEFKEAIRTKMNEAWEKIVEVWGNVMDFFTNIDLKQIGIDIINGLIKGIASMAGAVADAAKNIANGIGDKIAGILKLGSPSKLMEEYGEFTGEGLVKGIKNTVGKVQSISKTMAAAAIPDNMNSTNAFGAGEHAMAAPSEKSMTVNIHSPKALDVREANKEFARTMKRMSLMW